MADKKKHIDDLDPVTLPMTGNELIPVSQAGVVKVMKPGDFAALGDGYIKIDGSTAFGGNQSMGGYQLKSLGAPTDSADAVRKTDLEMRTAWKTIEW